MDSRLMEFERTFQCPGEAAAYAAGFPYEPTEAEELEMNREDLAEELGRAIKQSPYREHVGQWLRVNREAKVEFEGSNYVTGDMLPVRLFDGVSEAVSAAEDWAKENIRMLEAE